jgi:hypothetical protein
MRTLLSAVALGAILATAALAQTSRSSAGTKVGPSGDPNHVICINERETGSRLSSRRVCRTRAEWEEHRAQLRAELEMIQHPTQCTQADPNKC